MNHNDVTLDMMQLLRAALKESGKELKDGGLELKLVVSQELARLALAVGEPGYGRAVTAAQDNVALAAGLMAVSVADSSDARLLGIIQGALFMGAKALV